LVSAFWEEFPLLAFVALVDDVSLVLMMMIIIILIIIVITIIILIITIIMIALMTTHLCPAEILQIN